MKHLTQHQRILNYVRENGFIDRIKAFFDCGILELSSRICEIERIENIKFKKEWKKGVSRFGDKFTYIEYSLEQPA